MCNFNNSSVIYVPINELVENQFTSSIYREDKEYGELRFTISKEGIANPLIITTNNIIISGVRRLRIARELGMDTVPCIVNPIKQSEIEKHVLLSNQYRNKSEYERIIEWNRLKELFNVSQGTRTDLIPELREVKSIMMSEFSKSTLENYAKVFRLIDQVNDNTAKEECLNELKAGVTVNRVKNKLSKLVQKQNFQELAIQQSLKGDNVKIYNTSCVGAPNAEDNSVDCIVCSPPYFKLRDYNNGNNELGQESTSKEFVKNLVNIFLSVKRCLKSTGKIWVNLMDSMNDGHYCNVVERFIIAMEDNGFYVADKIVWGKKNPCPTSSQSSNIAHEMLICFTLEPRPTFNTLNIEGGIDFNDNTVSLNEGNRTISHWLIGEKTIITMGNNFNAIKNKCTERGIPFEHSAGFPSIIPQMLIQMSTKPGDVVMDIFMGTGTTGYETARLGRDFIGYELNPDYFKISQVRLEEFLNDENDRVNEIVMFNFKNRLEIPSSSYTEIFSKRILWPQQNYAS